MEKNIVIPDKFIKESEEITFTILLNCCIRELGNDVFYQGVPKYDKILRALILSNDHQLHLKLDFPNDKKEVYVPIKYRSELGAHRYFFPVFERDLETDTVREIKASDLLELIANHEEGSTEHWAIDNIRYRMNLSTEKIAEFLNYFHEEKLEPHKWKMSFIEAEQLLPIGHLLHPLTKGREGFSDEDTVKYTPEYGQEFQLVYFLVHPDLVEENAAKDVLMTDWIKDCLSNNDSSDKSISRVFKELPDWKVIPVHPWEAKYLENTPEILKMKDENLIVKLGEMGPMFTPTSSVRTLYSKDCEYMFKLSLHVKLTGAERINHIHELHRGYEVSRLMGSPWGHALKEKYPRVSFICDPSFVSVRYQGKVLDCFSACFRENIFFKSSGDNHINVLASLCQDGVMGAASRLTSIIKKASKITGDPLEEVAVKWFEQYLDILMNSVIGMFESEGMICEWHQQNTLIGFDEFCFPEKLFFRDNQSFLFRESFKNKIEDLVPGISAHSKMFIPDERLFDLVLHYVISGNILGLVNAFGVNKLSDERELISLVYDKLAGFLKTDNSGLIKHILDSRYWRVKGNLLTALHNIDCCENPIGVTKVQIPNVLHKRFFSPQLILPQGKEVVYSRYFPKEDVVISIRPIDLDQDLEMLHEWFHRSHAKMFWKMDWSLKELETYYRTLLPGDSLYSYIGMANGEPTFNIEVYWAIRDLVGDYFEVKPTDYGTHQFIAPTDPKKKYVSPATQCMVDYVFAQPEVERMVGEGDVKSMASMMNKAHVGFKIEKVIEMPHKKANLNFCLREWYWEKFPQNKHITMSPDSKTYTNNV
ncbi:GNAT family N-acetyltransferase [Flavivirga sp. 57AJ16]|uniref:GNAT family N-acetyltransferase n=1 Tax=Flavivirga sp. 57AJ16 TaxID=3025307 RepID=UPI00236549FC|nr:GNAT family N-acetyltransferase [Flavivirga sp. 57AJ16]MDD7887571.1 GNAT family N-acetyltransferase [Flavivirga sp. 57AJ16]